MKIAAVTEDGVTISQLFGRASFYMVFTIENSKVASLEKRPETGLHDDDAQTRHSAMAQTIDDCQVLIAGGMGWGAFKSLKSRNIQPVVTNVKSIDKAVKLYIAGKLPSFIERLH
jgi:predicted Fe-Mo cluster-binding NifX family protein